MDSQTKTIVDLKADCTCAQAHIAVHGRILTAMLCACTECQRASGSGHSAFIMVPLDAISVAGPTTSYTRKADSGADVTRYFCPTCATTLYSTTSRAPTVALLPVGLFSHSDWFHPRQIIFNKSRTHWDYLPDDIPAYDTYKET